LILVCDSTELSLYCAEESIVLLPTPDAHSGVTALPTERMIGRRYIGNHPDAIYVCPLMLVAIVAMFPYCMTTPARSFDTTLAIYRVFELDRSFHVRGFYPLLGIDRPFTCGALLFLFYPPPVGYVMLPFHPTTRWEPGEIVVDEQTIQIPAGTLSGTYLLLVGLYRRSPLKNLAAKDAERTLPGDRVVLGQIRVEDK
jgi:hypothetical protein